MNRGLSVTELLLVIAVICLLGAFFYHTCADKPPQRNPNDTLGVTCLLSTDDTGQPMVTLMPNKQDDVVVIQKHWQSTDRRYVIDAVFTLADTWSATPQEVTNLTPTTFFELYHSALHATISGLIDPYRHCQSSLKP